MKPILSSDELRKIKSACEEGFGEIEASLDLGKTRVKVKLGTKSFFIGSEEIELVKIRDGEKVCYLVEGRELKKVQYFSADSGVLYKLIPTSYRPILQISGTSMHKQPFIERVEKDKLFGKVLDSGTGLGYTAIAASKSADKVVTIEIDENVSEIARLNPYSQELFEDKKVEVLIGDLTEEIKNFRKNEFDFIIFDAGTPRSSGEFFSLKNYQEAFRVLKREGKLYHYLPKYHIKRGRDFGAEVIKRIKKAGFSNVERQTEDSYIVAFKN